MVVTKPLQAAVNALIYFAKECHKIRKINDLDTKVGEIIIKLQADKFCTNLFLS